MGRGVLPDSDLEDSLREIVRGAAQVTRAEFGGVVLVDERDQICHVVGRGSGRVGRDDTPAVLRDTDLHRALVENAHPFRLSHVADHPQLYGRVEAESALGGFLSIPVRERAKVWGSLYLAKSAAAVFSEDDEQLVAPFANAARIVVENAFLRERRRRSQEWLRATIDVTRSLLNDAGDEPLVVTGRAIRKVARADVVLVILPTSSDTVMIESSVGDGIDHLAGYAFQRAGSMADTVLRSGQPVIVADVQDHDGGGALRMLPELVDVRSMMLIPMPGKEGPRGVLAMGRRRGRSPFAPQELEPATVFANHATLALELADNRMEHHRLLWVEGRDRIAGELHDQILQRMFALGMSMQSVAGAVGAPHADRLQDLVAATDDLIRRVREVLRQLGGLEATFHESGFPHSGKRPSF